MLILFKLRSSDRDTWEEQLPWLWVERNCDQKYLFDRVALLVSWTIEKSLRIQPGLNLNKFFCTLGSWNREGNGTPLQYSCLENPMDGGAWQAAVHGVAKSRTRLSNFTFSFHFHALEKEMATHSSVLAWRIPGTGEPGGLPSLGSHRVGHD